MMLFRQAKADDLEAIHALALASGVGITTLPKDKALLKKRLTASILAFQNKVSSPSDEYYLFVLEDKTLEKIVGTSAIEAVTGHLAPFYSFQISKEKSTCPDLNLQNEYELLSLSHHNEGHSEICTLFLNETYRHHHNGLLLSRARFLFMIHFPHRFKPKIIAEMRGVSDAFGYSPFYEHVVKHFLPLSFLKADDLTLSTNKQFINDLMPKHPIYIPLIAPEAQTVIGKPHPSTLPAMMILLKEGFRFNQTVDIFDAGPTLEAPLQNIKTATQSHVLPYKKTLNQQNGELYLVANTEENFRATLSEIVVNSKKTTCNIPHETAELLHLKPNDKIRISPLRSQP